MSTNQFGRVKYAILLVILFSLALSLSPTTMRNSLAQETTEEPPTEVVEPTPLPTDPPPAPTEVTVAPTEVVTEVVTEEPPVGEVTPEPTLPPTEPSLEATDIVEPTVVETAVATEAPPVIVTPEPDIFQEDFQDGDVSDWVLSPNWVLTTENDNVFLSTSMAGEIALIDGLSWEHILLSAKVGLLPGNTMDIVVRSDLENYTIVVDASGHVDLYRSGLLLANGAATTPLPVDDLNPVPVWYEVTMMVSGGTISIAVDNAIQLAYDDVLPLPEGMTFFKTGVENTGVVMLDDVTLQKLAAPLDPTPVVTEVVTLAPTDVPTVEVTPIVTPVEVTPELTPVVVPTNLPPEETPETTPDVPVEVTPETTPDVDAEVTPETTPDVDAEVTPETTPDVDAEVTPEATPDVDAEVTPEATPGVDAEATPEATPDVTVPEEDSSLVLAEDFEGDLTTLLVGEGVEIVALDDGNKVAVLAPDAGMRPETPLSLDEQRIELAAQIVSDDESGTNGLALTFRSGEGHYLLSFETTQTALYRHDGESLNLLASVEVAHSLENWYLLRLDMQGGSIAFNVDGEDELIYHDETPLPAGDMAFAANSSSSVMVDDIAVYNELPMTPVTEERAAPIQFSLDDNVRSKFGSVLIDILEAYLAEDVSTLDFLIAQADMTADDAGRYRVFVWFTDVADRPGLASMIETMGGQVLFSGDRLIDAFVPLHALSPLAALEAVQAVALPLKATPAGNPSAPAGAPLAVNAGTGTVKPHSLDLIGVNSWHEAGYLGSGVNVAVIDMGFKNVASGNLNSADLPATCLPNPGKVWGYLPVDYDTFGSSSHGIEVMEVICDIAPQAHVYQYRVVTTDGGEPAAAIMAAVNGGYSSGLFPPADVIVVTSDLGSDSSLNTALAYAKSHNVPVIASAGNTGLNAVFNHTSGTTTTLDILVSEPTTATIRVEIDGTPSAMELNFSGNLGDPASTSPANIVQYKLSEFDCGATNCVYTLTIPSTGATAEYTVILQSHSGSIGNIMQDGVTPIAPIVDGRSELLAVAEDENAIAVGAVCALPRPKPDDGFITAYPLLETSAKGEAMVSDTPAGTQTNDGAIKPELVGPSVVNTSLHSVISAPNGCLEDPDNAFWGTSAAASHVGGMAALLMSNPNMAGIYSGSDIPAALETYLMSRAIDVEANGFDNGYGAGVAQLGNPRFNLNNEFLTGRVASGTSDYILPGTVYYVSSARLATAGSAQGTIDNPYTQTAYALQVALPGDAVILMPGEYVTPFDVPDGVDLVSFAVADALVGSPSTIWVNNMDADGGGLDIDNNAMVNGLAFTGANPDYNIYTNYNSSLLLKDLTPLKINAVGSVEILNNTFNNFDAPIEVTDGDGVVFQGNTFEGFRMNSSPGFTKAVLDISCSNTLGGCTAFAPVRLDQNIFQENFVANGTTTNDDWQNTLIGIRRSDVRLYRNTFRRNETESLITANQFWELPTVNSVYDFGPYIYSSWFEDNTLGGSLVHLQQARKFWFVNNTVTNNTMVDDMFRVGQAGGTASFWTGNTFDIHNNIFYANNVGGNLIDDRNFWTLLCTNTNGVGTGESVQNNWFIDAIPGGNCDVSASNNNTDDTGIYNMADEGERAAFDLTYFFMDNDPTHPYRLRPNLPGDPVNIGVDTGNDTLAHDPGTLILHDDLDLLGEGRFEGAVDIGAYEGELPTMISATGGSVTGWEEDAKVITFQMDNFVSDGIKPYTFTFDTYPEIYDTNTFNSCGGQPLVFNPVTYEATYCPPPNFHTQGLFDVSFDFTVTEALRFGTDSGTVTIEITSKNDGPPEDVFEDELWPYTEGQYQLIVTDYATEVRKYIKPYARFTPGGNPNFELSGPGVDFGWQFTLVSIDTIDANGNVIDDAVDVSKVTTAFEDAGNPVRDGSPGEPETPPGLLVIPVNAYTGRTGMVRIIYTVQEATNDGESGPVANARMVLISVNDLIAQPGFYDDTSLNIDYSGAWTPQYDATTYNNTYHVANLAATKNTFKIKFLGDTFVLHWLATKATGQYSISYVPYPGASINYNLDGLECSYGVTGADQPISTRLRAPGLTNVSVKIQNSFGCRGFEDIAPDQLHTLIVTVETDNVRLDAVEILDGGLLPGFYQDTELYLEMGYNGAWITKENTNAYGLTMHRSVTPGDELTFDVDGDAVDTLAIYSRTATNGGEYDVFVNGAFRRTINLYAAATYWHQTAVVPDIGSGLQTITIKNRSSSTQKVDIEAIELFGPTTILSAGTTVSDLAGSSDAFIFAGKWDHIVNAYAVGGTASKSIDATSSMVFEINGAGVAITHQLRYLGGTFEVCFDGNVTDCRVVNTYGGPANYHGYVSTAYAPATGYHTVEIRNLDTRQVRLEAITVLPARPALGVGFYNEDNMALSYKDGLWRPKNTANAMGGTYVFAQEKDAVLEFTIDGDTVDALVIYRKLQLGRGSFSVSINGGAPTSISNNSGTTLWTQPAVILLPDSATGPQTIRITTNSAARVEIEGFQLFSLDTELTGFIPTLDGVPGLNFVGKWAHKTMSGPVDGTFSKNLDATASLSFQINGAGVAITHALNAAYGSFEVCIDDDPCQTLNTAHGSVTMWGYVTPFYASSGSGSHRVTINSLTNAQIRIEAIDVLTGQAALGTGHYDITNANMEFAGEWRPLQNVTAVDGTFRRTSDLNGYMEFVIDSNATATDPQLRIYYSRGANNKKMAICNTTVNPTCVVGTGYEEIDTYRSTTLRSVPSADLGLGMVAGNGDYIIRIYPITPDKRIEVEAIDILGDPVAIPAGTFIPNIGLDGRITSSPVGTWVQLLKADAVGGTFVKSVTADSYLQFAIDGVGVAITHQINAIYDDLNVCFDNNPGGAFADCQMIDSNEGTARWGVVTTVYDPAATPGTPPTDAIRYVRIYNPTGLPVKVEAIEVIGEQSPGLGVGIYQEDDIALNNRGSGLSKTTTNALGGSFMRAIDVSTSIEFVVDVTEVNTLLIYHRQKLGNGNFSVTVDGTVVKSNIPTNAVITIWKQAAIVANLSNYDTGTLGEVVVEIDVLSAPVDIDAIELVGVTNALAADTVINTLDGASDIRFLGAWQHLLHASATDGTYAKTIDPTARMIFEIGPDAAGIAITHGLRDVWGTLEVCFDNDDCLPLNTRHGSAAYWGYVTPFYVDPAVAGTHTVTIHNTGTVQIRIEAIKVLDAPSALASGHYDITSEELNFMGLWKPKQDANAIGGTLRMGVYDAILTTQIKFVVDAGGLNDGTAPDIVVYYSDRVNGGVLQVCGVTCQTVSTTASATDRARHIIFTAEQLGLEAATNDQTIVIDFGSPSGKLDIEGINVAGPATGTYTPADGLIGNLGAEADINFIGPWQHLVHASAEGGTFSKVARNASEMRFEITGAGVAITHALNAAYGTYEVCFDDEPCQQQVNTAHGSVTMWGYTTNAYYPTASEALPSSATHTVTIRTIGNTQVRIEAIEVLPAPIALPTDRYDVTDPGIIFHGNWRPMQNATAEGGTFVRSDVMTDTIEFVVDANHITDIDVHYSGRTDGGIFRLCAAGAGGTCTTTENTYRSANSRDIVVSFDVSGLTMPGGSSQVMVLEHVSGAKTRLDIETIDIFAEDNTTLPLGPGFYEDDDPGLAGAYVNGTWEAITGATGRSGGTFHRTLNENDYMEFKIGGAGGQVTGFTVFVTRRTNGAPVDVCYTRLNSGGTPGAEVCTDDLVETKITTDDGTTRYMHGFSFYGLPYRNVANDTNETYTVTVTHKGTTTIERIEIDAVTVLGVSGDVLTDENNGNSTAGFFNDDDEGMVYSLAGNWRHVLNAGNMGGSRVESNRHGAVVQFTIEGNSFTLYQQLTTNGSREVRICVVTGDASNTVTNCTTVDQRYTITRKKVPVTIYGLGSGTHDIIIENLDKNGILRIEGIEVYD